MICFEDCYKWVIVSENWFYSFFYDILKFWNVFCFYLGCLVGVGVIKLLIIKWFWCWFKVEILVFWWDVGFGCFYIDSEFYFYFV